MEVKPDEGTESVIALESTDPVVQDLSTSAVLDQDQDLPDKPDQETSDAVLSTDSTMDLRETEERADAMQQVPLDQTQEALGSDQPDDSPELSPDHTQEQDQQDRSDNPSMDQTEDELNTGNQPSQNFQVHESVEMNQDSSIPTVTPEVISQDHQRDVTLKQSETPASNSAIETHVPESIQDDQVAIRTPSPNSDTLHPETSSSTSTPIPNPPSSPDESSQETFCPPSDLFNPPVEMADLSESELARALEPFGYGRDDKTGEQRTTLGNLPRILADFQKSRDTMYLSDYALNKIKEYALINPDKIIGNDFVMPLLAATRNSNSSITSPVPSGSQEVDTGPSSLSEDEDGPIATARPQRQPKLRHPASRVRTAESPPSSDGDHTGFFGTHSPSHSPSPTPSLVLASETSHQMGVEGDDSFDSVNETTIHAVDISRESGASPGREDTTSTLPHSNLNSTPVKFGKPLAALRIDLAKSNPSPLSSEPRRMKPVPPSRRRKHGSTDHRRIPSSLVVEDLNRTPSDGILNSDNPLPGPSHATSNHSTIEEAELTAVAGPSQNNEIDTTSYNPHLVSPTVTDDTTSTMPLTIDNMSSVIFQNRQRGLYSDLTDEDSSTENDVAARDDLMRRIRPDRPDRPHSHVYTRVFESGLGSDGYPTSSSSDLDGIREDYPKVIQECQELRSKVKELVAKVSTIERIHENEVVDLQYKVDELQEDLVARKKGEKELKALEGKYRFQLSTADEEVSKLNKELEHNQANYQRIRAKYEEAVGELDKLRTSLRSKDAEIRQANLAIQSHAGDLAKWDTERKFLDEHMAKLQNDLKTMQHVNDILEEQKQANIELKSTIDRLRHELDEQRAINSSSSVLGSRPSSLAGTVGPSFGDELKKAMATGEYDDEDSGSDTTEGGRDIMKLVGGLSGEGREEGDEVYEEIRIKRIKRRTIKPQNGVATDAEGGEGSRVIFSDEEEIAFINAQTDTHDLKDFCPNSSSKLTQTDPIPEPPPVYRPKTEDLQVQTERELEEDEATSRESLQRLLARTNTSVLKDVIANLDLHGILSLESKRTSTTTRTIIQDDSSSETTTEDPSSPLANPVTRSYFERFRFGSSGTSFKNSIVNIITPNNSSNPLHQPNVKPEFNLMSANFKICSTAFLIFVSGAVLGNIFSPGFFPSHGLILFRGQEVTSMGQHIWVNFNTLGGGLEGIMLGPNPRNGVLQQITELAAKIVFEGIQVYKRIPS